MHFGSVTSNSATLTVLSNVAPTGTITAPANGAQRTAAARPSRSPARARDPEDGALPPSAFTWRVDFHHDDHTHPHVRAHERHHDAARSRSPIAAKPPRTCSIACHLTVRDSSGLTHTSSVDVRPLTSVVRIESNLSNAQLTLDGMPITAPFSFTGVEGVIRTLGVVTPQTSGGTTYDFVSWSDGGAGDARNRARRMTTRPSPRCSSRRRPMSCSATTSRPRVAGRSPPARIRRPRGCWQRGDPQATSSSGVTLQPGTCDGSLGQLLRHRTLGGCVSGRQRCGRWPHFDPVAAHRAAGGLQSHADIPVLFRPPEHRHG